jgi:uncharacterized phiE125 gp8 family phage protein
MMIDPQLVSRAPVLPVALDRAKAHLRIDVSDDDDLISDMIKAAADYAEGFLGRTLVDTTYDLVLDAFPKNRAPLALPRPPLIDLDGVYVLDADDNETALDGVVVDRANSRLIAPGNGWPTGTGEASIRVRYRAGYVSYDAESSPPATEGAVPSAIVAALLLTIGSLYQHREDQAPTAMTTVPLSAERLLRMYRVELGMA